MHRVITLAAALTVYLVSLSAGELKPAPHTVTGVALDAQGRPIAGARIWIKPALTTGLLQARTDENGRYHAEGLINVPYRVFAWHKFSYHEKNVCMRLAPESLPQYDSFVPTAGVVRNFRLQVAGPIDDRDGMFYGAEMLAFARGPWKLEFTFVPVGPLADGSQGKSFTRTTERDRLITNIPVGAYRVTVNIVETNGARRRAQLSRVNHDTNLTPEALLEFESKDSCIGSFGNGLTRAYLYVQ